MKRDRKRQRWARTLLLLTVTFVASACGANDGAGAGSPTGSRPTDGMQPASSPSPTPMTVSEDEVAEADLVVFTGEAPQGTDNGGYGFEEEGISSPGPTITVPAGEPLTLVLQNISEEFIPHDLAVVDRKDESATPLWGSQTSTIDPGESTLVTFTPEAPGTYFYICSLLGHLSGHGMWGRFVVE